LFGVCSPHSIIGTDQTKAKKLWIYPTKSRDSKGKVQHIVHTQDTHTHKLNITIHDGVHKWVQRLLHSAAETTAFGVERMDKLCHREFSKWPHKHHHNGVLGASVPYKKRTAKAPQKLGDYVVKTIYLYMRPYTHTLTSFMRAKSGWWWKWGKTEQNKKEVKPNNHACFKDFSNAFLEKEAKHIHTHTHIQWGDDVCPRTVLSSRVQHRFDYLKFLCESLKAIVFGRWINYYKWKMEL
jgi:hypothetical protein